MEGGILPRRRIERNCTALLSSVQYHSRLDCSTDCAYLMTTKHTYSVLRFRRRARVDARFTENESWSYSFMRHSTL